MLDGNLFVGSLVLLLIFLIVVAASAFWIWMLVDCARKEPDTGNRKVVWIVVILLGHVVGALAYYFAGRPRRPPVSPNPGI